MSRKRLSWWILLLLTGVMSWGSYRAVRQSALNHDLLVASAKGDPLTVRALLDQGADPNTQEDADTGSSWQHFLARLLRRQPNDAPIYPLTRALTFGTSDANHVEIARLLLEHHANPNVKMAGGVPAILRACRNRSDGVLTLLLQHGANPNTVDRTGCSLLMYALEEQNPASIRALLDHGANPNLANVDGDVPLMWATLHQDANSIALLLAHGADVNHKNARGQTALTYSLQSGLGKIPDRLLEAGADVKTSDSEGCSPFLYALLLHNAACAHMLAKGADVRKAIPLSPAIQGFTIRTRTEGSSGSVTWGLICPPGATPLMLAVRCNDPALVRAILAKGADVNARDAKGKTALNYAEDNPEIRALLQHAGARRER